MARPTASPTMPNATPDPKVMPMNQVNPLTISCVWNPT
jgi:hypothetical protein